MVELQGNIVNVALFLIIILYLQMTLLEAKKLKRKCPIGFQLGFTRSEQKVCYTLKKNPEAFTGKFDNCTENLFTLPLYNSMGIPKSDNLTIWTDYKALYPGGPFVDWSYTDDTGEILETTYEVNINPFVSVDEQLCVAIHPVDNFTAVRCDEMHHRYCFVEPYDIMRFYETPNVGCDDLVDGIRFWSPTPTCLATVTGEAASRTGVVNATWSQSQRICQKRGGSILGQGWRYSNYFNPIGTLDSKMPLYPLNVIFNMEHTVLRYDGDISSSEIPSIDWHFDGIITRDTSLGAIDNYDFWDLVNGSYRFLNVICERPVELRHVNLTVSVSSGDELIMLTVNDTLLDVDIICFTDSSRYFPQKVSFGLHSIKQPNVYILKAIENGYYWCTHSDSKNFYISESNRALYVKVKESTENLYAVKIRTFGPYKLDKISNLLENIWKRKIDEYVFYSTRYTQIYGDSNTYVNYTIMNFKKNSPGLHWEDLDIIQKLKLKRLYLDARTALLHVELHPQMKPGKPGQWENIDIEYMKPAYYCDKETKLSLGMSHSTADCKAYTCIGNYNDGVQMVITPQDKCYLPAPVTLTTAVNVTEVTSAMITVTPASSNITATIRPDQQLLDVIEDLKHLLHNNSDLVMVQDINNAFDKVDEILIMEDLNIPGTLLHLLDELGARIDLNGSRDSSIVRQNIALLVADAEPSMPVRGLRVAARDYDDVFNNNTFEIIREEITSSQLLKSRSEVVVSLPESVATSTHRISFVVFRTDRAFQAGHDGIAVNSRVLSVKVENITEFHDGEVIDIHLSPFIEIPERNQSRVCAFWQFNEDGSGYWSQEGCTFIQATQQGLLDTCRCDHLTHFAEILIPRTVFSERNEAALEILSIIGCCLSLVGLIIVALTALLFRSWRRVYSNKVWLQLCISIFLLSLCFLVIVFAQFQENDIVCLLTGVALHYSVLASFCWMLVAAVLSYRRLVLVFTRDASHKLLRASAFAWGAPCAVVGVLLAVAPHSYAGRYEEKSPSGAFCYPSGLALWLAVYAPIAVMLLANWTLFTLIVRSVFSSKRPQNHGNGENEALRCASISCLLIFLFGLPWIFGLFSLNVVFAYFFTIFITFQGFVLFLFFVLGDKKTRDLWLDKLKIKQTKQGNLPRPLDILVR